MSGHSKWANIKRRKGAADAARGKVFTKLIREITVAARVGGGDPDANPRLRAAVDKARANSMPRDTIERAIARGSGGVDTTSFEEVQFEGYGAGGVAVLVQVLTDNRHRATADVRHAFTRTGGNLGTTGCVGFLFRRVGIVTLPTEGVDEDALLLAAIEAGADDVSREDDVFEVTCSPEACDACLEGLRRSGFAPSGSELTYVATTQARVEGKQAEQILRLVETLEDSDDVQNVYTNAELSDTDLEAAGG
ncbi:MAG: YebC/PmpR family DNA-binding transcriptional regulator [Deltaproteobacteria bacterium]|nr:YebC/PmpR family DNA-binding transcriptional regulator [Deltaproteobacteria bacterium]